MTGCLNSAISRIFVYHRDARDEVRFLSGHPGMAVVMTTAAIAMATPTASTHCLSARRRITESLRGTPKHVRRHSLQHSAVARGESKKL